MKTKSGASAGQDASETGFSCEENKRILLWEKIITTRPKISLKTGLCSNQTSAILFENPSPKWGRHASTSPDFTFFGQDIQGFGYELPTKASRQAFEGFGWTGNGERF
ncbi:predicted protein [Coccidioides posadasii str. Silveira]|uniref:Predicted protein n=1 Tax=Coccidioides posadasii (strain RMSCC 757 / Silveira) TaxID=443226 RepID=E9D671_COCPS|nr:predicted protein [Coccidioides posadasii str. Silveira]